MGGVGAWLAAAVGPLARKVLAALGIGVISYAGMMTAVTQALQYARGSWNSMPQDLVFMLGKFGFVDYIALVVGGILAAVSLKASKRFGVLTGGGGA
jgi:hypothetical protein